MKLKFMPKPYVEPTNAGNLEAKFDAGEDVLDYFDLRTVKIVVPMEAPAVFGHGVSAGGIPSMIQLKRAVRIAEQIQKLENELNSILVKRGVQSGKFPAHKPKGRPAFSPR